ncbi:hypothetical protein G3480_17900 [Thiorhodococcus mannitoliphagus]|uniref:Uncharacterized protein n=1 Tax=Thiorhodococcus mannitoliphagus TaxID=329406 RepID=A0A6P1E392_9GAMM|nr:hypothetical protein [Thiorhodococcus mannitoliphagus]NEX22155.1 hypothetical protein [Thiorhodococcus mannitoliphagus]
MESASVSRTAVLGLLLAIGLATSSAETLRTSDPCEMIRMSDIEALFPGERIQITTHDTEAANPLGMRRCFWSAGEDMKFVQLSLTIDADSKAMNIEQQFMNNKLYVQDAKDVPDVGDAAYYGGSGMRIGAGLHSIVKDKGVMLNVMVGLGLGDADDQRHIEIERSLAKKVIEKL